MLFFAKAAEVVGCSKTEINVEQGCTVETLLKQLAELYPKFMNLHSRFAVAIDTKLCSFDAQLHDGCTVAILPPVSGG